MRIVRDETRATQDDLGASQLECPANMSERGAQIQSRTRLNRHGRFARKPDYMSRATQLT